MVALYINGKDAYATYKAWLGEGSLVALMKPAPNKPYLENKSAAQHGKQVLIDEERAPALVDERTLNLIINIEGATQQAMLANWKSLVTELAKGWVHIRTSVEPDVVYRLTYQDCAELKTFFNRKASFTFKFNEPNPNNRSV